jgi:hypothetical protein
MEHTSNCYEVQGKSPEREILYRLLDTWAEKCSHLQETKCPLLIWFRKVITELPISGVAAIVRFDGTEQIY